MAKNIYPIEKESILVALPNLLKQIPVIKFCRKTAWRVSGKGSALKLRPDAVWEIGVGNSKWMLVAETKKIGQPCTVRQAVLALEHLLLRTAKPHYGVVVAPFISEASAEICCKAGMGYVDLVGNACLVFGSVYIEKKVARGITHQAHEYRRLFSSKLTRAMRALLQGPLHPWKALDIVCSANVSLGSTTSLRRALIEREWAEETSDGLCISQPRILLDAWATADEWKRRTLVEQEYSVLTPDATSLAEKICTVLAEESPVLTGAVAGWFRKPYTTPTSVTAYIKNFPSDALVRDKLLGRSVPRGSGNLRLVLPEDEGVRFFSQEVRGLPLVCDLQIYLDLLQEGGRSIEQAAELLKSSDFSGGWS